MICFSLLIRVSAEAIFYLLFIILEIMIISRLNYLQKKNPRDVKWCEMINFLSWNSMFIYESGGGMDMGQSFL